MFSFLSLRDAGNILEPEQERSVHSFASSRCGEHGGASKIIQDVIFASTQTLTSFVNMMTITLHPC